MAWLRVKCYSDLNEAPAHELAAVLRGDPGEPKFTRIKRPRSLLTEALKGKGSNRSLLTEALKSTNKSLLTEAIARTKHALLTEALKRYDLIPGPGPAAAPQPAPPVQSRQAARPITTSRQPPELARSQPVAIAYSTRW